jgi:outer membrane protein TolC
LQRAQLNPARARRWLRDARRAALLPQVDLSWEHRYDRGWQHDSEPGEPDELQSGHDATDVWRVKATWKLDRLWFNPEELRASRAQADLGRWREELLVEVTHLYFERLRAQASTRNANLTPDERAEARLQLREFQGLLEAMTGLRWPP